MNKIKTICAAVLSALFSWLGILENLLDIGIDIPPFLMPLAKMIKGQVEDKTKVE